MIWLEEAETTNYQSKKIQQIVKQMSTENASVRGHYEKTRAAKNIAIVGMNTNSPDLYGLVNADNATLERLVIIEYKKKDANTTLESLRSMLKKLNEDPCFDYSIWNYLKNDYEIPASYSPFRYLCTSRFCS